MLHLLALLSTARAADEDARSWAVLPGAFYSQETSVGLAAFGTATFPVRGTGEPTWPSTVSVAAVYTFRQQASLSAFANLYLGEANDWAIESEAFVEHFPMDYHGLGPDAEPSAQKYTRRRFRSDNTLRRRVSEHVFVGLAHRLAFTAIPDISPPEGEWTTDDLLGSGVTGDDGSRVHGAGALARWDTRDDYVSTRTGVLLDGEVTAYPTWLGGTSGFAVFRADARAFLPLGAGTLATQAVAHIGTGDPPFTAQFELGGDDLLRGMYQGRYRDRSAWGAQVELRHPVVWRFGVVAFAAMGHVFHTVPDRAPRWTAGGGLRFELDEQTRSTLRLDVGGGPDGTGFIFTFGEAF